MEQDLKGKLDAVMNHLRDSFSAGQNSVSKFDALPGGDCLGDSVESLLNAAFDSKGRVHLLFIRSDDLDALRCMDEVWGNGFDLVSRDDFANVHGTLGDIAESYRRLPPVKENDVDDLHGPAAPRM